MNTIISISIKLLVGLILAFSFNLNRGKAQSISYYGDLGYTYGFSNNFFDYSGNSIKYGYGNGLGISAGFQFDSSLPLFLYAEAGIKFAFALQYQSMNGNSNKSSFSFNHKSFSFGIGHFFNFNGNEFIKGLRLHTGVDYNLPSDASLTENNNEYGTINYDNSLGYQFGAKLSLFLNDKLLLEPGFTVRLSEFSYNNFQWNSGIPSNFMLNPITNHLQLGLTLRKLIGE